MLCTRHSRACGSIKQDLIDVERQEGSKDQLLFVRVHDYSKKPIPLHSNFQTPAKPSSHILHSHNDQLVSRRLNIILRRRRHIHPNTPQRLRRNTFPATLPIAPVLMECAFELSWRSLELL